MAGAAPGTPQQAAKRRRLETVSQTLARPFRSPFKPTAASALNHQPSPSLPSPSPLPYDKTAVTAPTTTTATATPKQGNGGGIGGVGVLPTPPRSLPPPLPSSASRQPLFSSPAAGARTKAWPGAVNRAPPGLPVPGRPAAVTASGAASLFSPSLAGAATAASLSASDPAVRSLLKTQRTLEREVAAARSEVDTLRQAYKIEATGADDELLALIQKWRLASRAAAEVVYVDVRDRVNRMGGVSAWKNMQRRRDEWRTQDDDSRGGFGGVARSGEDARNSRRGRQRYGDDDEDSERKSNNDDDDKYAEYDVYDDDNSGTRAAARDDKYNNDNNDNEDDDNEFFTMDMMLKSLGIELDVIGFDKRLQRWVD